MEYYYLSKIHKNTTLKKWEEYEKLSTRFRKLTKASTSK